MHSLNVGYAVAFLIGRRLPKIMANLLKTTNNLQV